MDAFFKISERGSSVSREVIGGFTTFLAMAYIVAVNPSILSAAGVPFVSALTSTCLGAAIATAAMGLIANRPIALASGMGLNAVVAYTLCLGEAGVDWRVAMAVVFVEGVAILILVLVGLRKAVLEAIPPSLRHAIGIGIGLFVAFVGLQGGGIVVSSTSTLVTIGDLSSPGCLVAIVSIVSAVALLALKIKGGLALSIVLSVAIGIPLGVTVVPEEWTFAPDFSAFAAPFQIDPATGTVALLQVFLQPALIMAAFSLFMSDFFDTLGGVVAIGDQAGFTDKDGNVDDVQPILAVDSAAAALGGFLGASSITSFIESAAGAAAGARTGLSNLVVAALFACCAFLSPVFSMISGPATCGALVVVGCLMLVNIGSICWSKIEFSLPSALIIICIPLMYSITSGIGFGFIAYCIVCVLMGKGRSVKPLMWVTAAAFVAMFSLT